MPDQAPPAPAPAAPIASLPGYTALILPLLALAAQFGVGLLLALLGIGAFLGRSGSPVLVLLAATGLSALCYLLIVQVVLQRHGWRWADLGLAQSANGAIALAIAIGLGTAMLGTLFDAALHGQAGSPFRRMGPLEFALAALVLCMLVPAAEEILFRGVVFPVLRARLGDATAAIIVSALIFGVFHLVPAQILVGTLLGVPLAWLRHRSGSLLPPIALHVTHNLGVVSLTAWGAF